MCAFSVTNTFSAGTTAVASEVNQNFTDIEDAFNGVTATTLTLPPIGSVIAWLKNLGTNHTPALPAGWVECNGQVLSDAGSPYNGDTIPDLNGSSGTERFLRGQTTSGGTGGAETHTHGIADDADAGGNQAEIPRQVTPANTDAGSSLPSYYEVVWIMRIK